MSPFSTWIHILFIEDMSLILDPVFRLQKPYKGWGWIPCVEFSGYLGALLTLLITPGVECGERNDLITDYCYHSLLVYLYLLQKYSQIKQLFKLPFAFWSVVWRGATQEESSLSLSFNENISLEWTFLLCSLWYSS